MISFPSKTKKNEIGKNDNNTKIGSVKERKKLCAFEIARAERAHKMEQREHSERTQCNSASIASAEEYESWIFFLEYIHSRQQIPIFT